MGDTSQVVEEKPQSKPEVKPASKPRTQQLPPFRVVLLDDDDHTYDYVIDMLQTLFAHSEPEAFALAQQVDKSGRAIVCVTHKERAEFKRDQILGFGCDIRLSRSNGSMKAVIEPVED